MDFSGRIGRRRYIVAQLFLVPLGSLWGLAFALAMSNLSQTFSKDAVPKIVRGLTLAPVAAEALLTAVLPLGVALLVVGLSFTVRRLHDLGFSGWFALLWPIFMMLRVGLSDEPNHIVDWTSAFEAVLMMVPGVPEANLYGACPHPRTDSRHEPEPVRE